MRYLFFIGLLACFSCNNKIAKSKSTNILENILQDNRETLGPIIDQAEEFEIQIQYTQINRDAKNRASFESHQFNVNPERYFYPASSVKMPIAFLAVQKLNEIKAINNLEELNIHTPIFHEAFSAPQTAVKTDESAQNKKSSIAHYIQKIFAVSDNDAYNRLYEFLGQDYINDQLRNKGYFNSRIIHRLGISGFDKTSNQIGNPIYLKKGEQLIYHQPASFAKQDWDLKLLEEQKGLGYINSEGNKVDQPMDFSGKNFISISNLQDILKAVLFPETIPANKRFNLRDEDYEFLYKAMFLLPKECEYPKYDTTEYYDSYVKFFLFGDNKKPMPDHIRIFNKVGYAYGYLTDCAYIVDFKNNIEFFLTATILVNKNKVYNDDTYEYDEIGIPFLANLGKAVYDYELKRKRAYVPDLSKFQY